MRRKEEKNLAIRSQFLVKTQQSLPYMYIMYNRHVCNDSYIFCAHDHARIVPSSLASMLLTQVTMTLAYQKVGDYLGQVTLIHMK